MPGHSEEYLRFLRAQQIAAGDIDEADEVTEEMERPAPKVYQKEKVEVDMPVMEKASIETVSGGENVLRHVDLSAVERPESKAPVAKNEANMAAIRRQKAVAEIQSRLGDENPQDVLNELLEDRNSLMESGQASGGEQVTAIERLNLQIEAVQEAIRRAA